MDPKNNFYFVGVSHGWGARNTGTYLGPRAVTESEDPFNESAKWTDYFQRIYHLDAAASPPQDFVSLEGKNLEARRLYCAETARRLYEMLLQELKKEEGRPFVLGGDQSISVGTWSAVADYAAQKASEKPLGLIWIDAHLDAHTPQTSLSQAPHGMAAAVLMGYGGPGVGKTKIMPDRLVYIGARSYEEGEHDLLKSLGVKIYYQSDVESLGFAAVFQGAKEYVTRGGCPFGIALDIDAFDPQEAPGTGASAPGGLKSQEALPILGESFRDKKLMAFELVEFNPKLDYENKTLNLIWKIFYLMIGKELR